MILMIDNYDSFVYNLVQYLKTLGEEVRIYRNDDITIEQIRKLNPEVIIISPGPCTPKEAGISLEVLDKLKGEFPILGICLGHQSIGMAFGADIVKGEYPIHGKVFPITNDGKGVFTDLPSTFKVTRYHSLVVDPDTLPKQLEITAKTEDGAIMGLRHREYMIEGVQFHPEAVLTEYGHEMLANFLKLAKSKTDVLKGEVQNV